MDTLLIKSLSLLLLLLLLLLLFVTNDFLLLVEVLQTYVDIISLTRSDLLCSRGLLGSLYRLLCSKREKYY